METNTLHVVGEQVVQGTQSYVGDVLIILGEIVCLVGIFWAFRLLMRAIDKYFADSL